MILRDIQAYLQRVQLSSSKDDDDRAIEDYSAIIQLAPYLPYCYAARGLTFFNLGEIEKFTADLLRAIELNPGDAGRDYQPNSEKELSPTAIRHGEEQVRKMLADRPVMAQHVEPGDTLWIWAVRKFAGEDLGSLVEWNAEETEHFPGRSGRPWNGRNAGIQVSTTRVDLPDNRPSTFDELWLTAVFELHNVTSSPDWDRIDECAIQGELMRDEYIVAMLESEELAATSCAGRFISRSFCPGYGRRILPLRIPGNGTAQTLVRRRIRPAGP